MAQTHHLNKPAPLPVLISFLIINSHMYLLIRIKSSTSVMTKGRKSRIREEKWKLLSEISWFRNNITCYNKLSWVIIMVVYTWKHIYSIFDLLFLWNDSCIVIKLKMESVNGLENVSWLIWEWFEKSQGH